jgi:hypothetical protein
VWQFTLISHSMKKHENYIQINEILLPVKWRMRERRWQPSCFFLSCIYKHEEFFFLNFSGIGLTICERLLTLHNDLELCLLCRNVTRAEAAKNALLSWARALVGSNLRLTVYWLTFCSIWGQTYLSLSIFAALNTDLTSLVSMTAR